ncbi:hypothetical protein OG539_35445 [Actinacidiphila glaucinigra]|uniref:hypothetical protein n=1 Tax=Actinacidiphila glaucinigra TaxID=235986 RepID=UPI002DDA9007|nr:hypothetical protein [Actinacidiphila glaucinigra]WSD58826.1 hypothetical protein OIE69_07835 [Actinacidiphila glaucinigra]
MRRRSIAVADDTAPAPPHPLASVRRSHGWSYQDLARVVADNARALGVPMAARREKVWRWEHWGVVPERDSQRALARALGVRLREVDARPWPGWLPTFAGIPDGLPWTRAGGLDALDALLDGGGRDPRGHPVLEGPEFRDAVTDWTAATDGARGGGPSPGGAVAGREGQAADEETVAWLERGVLGLRRLDDRLGGAAVRHRVEADLRIALDLLRRGPSRGGLDARLLRAAAGLAQLGGWSATDCGRHGAAQRHFLTGLRLAHGAQDRPQAANLWAGLSLQAVFAGRHDDALTAARAAESAAAGATSRTRAMLATRRARAHAGLGEDSACRRSLEEAGRLLDTAPGDDDPSWIYWFDEAELCAQSGIALLDLGRAEEAAPLLEKALAIQDPLYRRDRTLYTARAALARALTGDLDTARTLTGDAVELARDCGSPRVAIAVEQARTALTPAR